MGGSLFVVVTLMMATPAMAGQVTHPDRESTYPVGIANVTHAPWAPRPGEDVTVTLTLAPDTDPPEAAGLLYCRVEPDYVCVAVPPKMTSADDGRTWTATIRWDPDFMRSETRHVGYNITLRHADPSAETGVRREYIPLGNHWVPPDYPTDSDGIYYFYAYTGKAVEGSPMPGPILIALIVLLGAALPRRRRGAGRV